MKSLKLNKIEGNCLEKRELVDIKGGHTMVVGNCIITYSCSCGCQYENRGGSSTNANMGANKASGLRGSNPTVWCDARGDCN